MTFNNGVTSQESDIPINKIYCDDDFNCRGSITRMDVMDLMRDIEQNGLLQPIMVQPWTNPEHPECDYRIVLGHRRYTACKFLGKETIHASVKTGLAETDAMRYNFMENLKRKDLNVLQEARYLGKFRLLGLTLDQIATIVGYSQPWVLDRLNLLKLPKDIQEEVAAGLITLTQAKVLIKESYSEHELYTLFKEMKDKKARGELTFKITAKKDNLKHKNPLSSKVRLLSEIHSMQDMIAEACGTGIETRILGWVGGHATTFELLEDLEDHSALLGINWKMPEEIRAKAEKLKDLT